MVQNYDLIVPSYKKRFDILLDQINIKDGLDGTVQSKAIILNRLVRYLLSNFIVFHGRPMAFTLYTQLICQIFIFIGQSSQTLPSGIRILVEVLYHRSRTLDPIK